MSDIDITPPADQDAPDLSELRAAAQRGTEAVGRAAEAERKLAFVEAGIPYGEGPGALLFKTYEGDATKEAVIEAAAGYGITPPAAEQPAADAPVISPDEREQGRERSDLASGAEAPTGEQTPHPVIAGLSEFRESLQGGQSREDAAAAYYNRMVDRAAAGDPRAVFDQKAHTAQAAALRGREG